MKFWQKIFVSMLLLFVIVFDLGALVLVNNSYQFILKRETENALREQQTILSSLQTSIENVSTVYPGAVQNETRLQAIITPLAEYYQKQDVLFSLYLDGDELFTNAPMLDAQVLELAQEQAVNILDHVQGGIRYLSLASKLPEFPQLAFVYTRSIQPVEEYIQQISSFLGLLNLIVCPLLGGLVYLILRRMTRPIRQMKEASTAIANGAYDERVRLVLA